MRPPIDEIQGFPSPKPRAWVGSDLLTVARNTFLLLACLAAVGSVNAGAAIQLTEAGVVIDAGAAARFCLEYPELTDGAQQGTPASGVTVSGNTATMTYPSGTKLTATRTGATIALHFTGLTDAAKGFRMAMLLPVDFKDGGTWQLADEKSKPFPALCVGEQFVLKGEPKPLTLTPPRGGAFTLAMPYGWQQIQDNRKWNTDSFGYLLATAMPGNGTGEAWYSFRIWAGGLEQAPAEPLPAAVPPPAKPAPAATGMQLTPAGLVIEAGSSGHFTLNHPVLVGERWDQVRTPIERTVSGNTATLRFAGDTRLEVIFQPGAGTLTYSLSNAPADVKSIRSDMLIDFSYANGGTWKAGDGAEKPFALEKPAQPHLYQGSADAFLLKNFAGASLKLDVPPHSFQQLTDNREWGWKIFAWQFSAPYQVGDGPCRVKVTLGAPAAGAAKLADRFGQNARAGYPDKLKTEAELKQDAPAEKAWLASLNPPVMDRYGGLPGSQEKLGLRTTGFFHVEKRNERWILVDPAGNAFFHLGICGLNPSDDYTYVKGREEAYEWLPPHDGEFRSAFHPDAFWNPDTLSFHLVNWIRKSGRPYSGADYTTRMIERVRKWGFNSAGAFGAGDAAARLQASFPHVASLPLSQWDGFPEVPGTHGGIWDPFDESLRARCDRNFAAKIAPAAGDPLIIGYFLVNEPLYEELPAAVAALDGAHACKQRLVQMLEEKYRTIAAFNQAWGTSLASFADVAARGLPVQSAAAQADLKAFTGLFLEVYFKLVTDTFHRHDSHHLLLGNRLQPGTIKNEQLCRIGGQYLDVVSFNYYTWALDRALLDRIHGWTGDRPMFLSEFYFSAPKESGLLGGGQELATQRERGLAYRQYVEQAAATGYIVGIEWFTLVDQATTGRFFEKYNGESANTGLIAVSDRPYKALLAEMMRTNYDIYQVLLGARPPFVFDDPRFKITASK